MALSHADLEDGTIAEIDFDKLISIAARDIHVVPAVVQQFDTLEVLMVGYVNAEALKRIQDTGKLFLWSTSRNQLWEKGATSGDTVTVKEIRINCEQNSLLLLVEKSRSGLCHTRSADGATRPLCYYRKLLPNGELAFIAD